MTEEMAQEGISYDEQGNVTISVPVPAAPSPEGGVWQWVPFDGKDHD